MRRFLIVLILACCAALPSTAPRAQDASDKLSFDALTTPAPGGNPGPRYGSGRRSSAGGYRARSYGGYHRAVRSYGRSRSHYSRGYHRAYHPRRAYRSYRTYHAHPAYHRRATHRYVYHR